MLLYVYRDHEDYWGQGAFTKAVEFNLLASKHAHEHRAHLPWVKKQGGGGERSSIFFRMMWVLIVLT